MNNCDKHGEFEGSICKACVNEPKIGTPVMIKEVRYGTTYEKFAIHDGESCIVFEENGDMTRTKYSKDVTITKRASKLDKFLLNAHLHEALSNSKRDTLRIDCAIDTIREVQV